MEKILGSVTGTKCHIGRRSCVESIRPFAVRLYLEPKQSRAEANVHCTPEESLFCSRGDEQTYRHIFERVAESEGGIKLLLRSETDAIEDKSGTVTMIDTRFYS